MSVPRIGQAELEILRFVADRGTVTVREVADHMAQAKGAARTTVLTVMERLRRKGYLARRKVDGRFRYQSRNSKPALLQLLVRQFVEQTLEGALEPFMAYLSQAPALDARQLAELKKLVRDLEARQQGERR